MQLGFIIDHTRCIGCHACTVACKSENHVPVGSFRTWVKYTEAGTFPEVKRSFSVLRCNQCTEAPCVEICPVTALDKRQDGIVDVDPDLCIGCKSCMHACPYDALYINEDSGVAEKCHFCAHRTEVGLAPACAVVCPTEAIIPGDFDDPESSVSRISREQDLSVRKPEAGTGPNVRYLGAESAGLQPGETNLSEGFIWSAPPEGERLAVQAWEQRHDPQSTRTTYDVPRNQLWGGKITAYLWAKSVAAGTFPLAFLVAAQDLGWTSGLSATGIGALLVSLVALAVTGACLVLDLKRPERFLYILLKPNWNSWLVKGSYIILGYGLVLGVALLNHFLEGTPPNSLLSVLVGGGGLLLGAATAGYTGFLFAQAKGRVLWMRRYSWVHLIVQAGVAGSASLYLLGAVGIGLDSAHDASLVGAFHFFLGVHLIFTLLESKLAPEGREEEYARASRLLTHGPFARLHWVGGVLLGIAVPIVILWGSTTLAPLAALLALIGLWIEEDLWVRAGQALPIS